MPPSITLTNDAPPAKAGRAEIRVLPPLVVNQIAAGEVVERPASVVKELVDNAIDAGATSVVIEIEQGGIELIRVTDDGAGIPSDQLTLAIAPHATSKIRHAGELDAIATMGFRGEALASIASVSRLMIRSRTAEDAAATRLEVAGEDLSALRPEAGPVGTCLTVRNLFFNTPARRRFLRTPQTEQGHCVDIVENLALAHPAIAFSFRADGRTIFDLPREQSPVERALAVIGGEMREQYVEVSADRFDDARGLTLWGMVGLPGMARQTTRWQHLFVNGRPVRDKTIQHALKEAFRGLIEPGRHPAAVLMIEMTPAAVDVNVHPAKAEVRFRDSSLVHRVVLSAVREALRRADLTPDAGATGFGAASGLRFEPVTEPKAGDRTPRQRLVDYLKGFAPQGDGSREESTGSGGFDFAALRAAVEAEDARIEADRRRLEEERRFLAQQQTDPANAAAILGGARGIPAARILQIHDSYLVTQDEHGVVIIDQHALHERVMFEKLKARIGESGALESQRLLVPASAGVTARQVELLDSLADLFEKLGIECVGAGPSSIAVHAFPTLLFDRGVDPASFMRELLDRAERSDLPESSEGALHEVLDMMACKAAVKAGDRLTDAELGELLAMRDRVERSSRCPHGRPTTIRLSLRELEKQFGRS